MELGYHTDGLVGTLRGRVSQDILSLSHCTNFELVQFRARNIPYVYCCRHAVVSESEEAAASAAGTSLLYGEMLPQGNDSKLHSMHAGFLNN